ncbi:hypothetical protein TCELL_0917 [Thermogladius calderae 1633]|uniref:Uncharacterized protein n=1 Tax=Thermogladius calderae (strain DSM 22663 / VKM B-2946 / 1633) TaxID=1184251 RepID=I3TF03_THEC1|nr:hypothetical protein TCELL_0917 [Thermogladius calderae 1633]
MIAKPCWGGRLVNRVLVSALTIVSGVFYGAEAFSLYVGLSYVLDLLAFMKPLMSYFEGLRLVFTSFNLLLSLLSLIVGVLVLKIREERLVSLSPVLMFVTVASIPVGGGFLVGSGLSALATSLLLGEGVEVRLA